MNLNVQLNFANKMRSRHIPKQPPKSPKKPYIFEQERLSKMTFLVLIMLGILNNQQKTLFSSQNNHFLVQYADLTASTREERF